MHVFARTIIKYVYFFRIMKAPVGVTTAHDEAKKKINFDKVNTVIPDKKMQDLLKG